MCSSAETARLFFALNPDARARRGIASVQRRLDLPARQVPARNLHLTLAFLGNVETARIPELLTIGSGLGFSPCTLVLNRFGSFPRSGVGWLGSDQLPGALVSFQNVLASRLIEHGFRVDARRWQPHVTLYRNLRKPCGRMSIEAVCWTINGYCLMKSTHTETGLVYDPLGQWATAY